MGRRVAVRRPPGAPLSLRGCPHHVRSPVCREATPSPALTHAESHLRLWDVNADSFWVQPADSQCTTVAPASAEWPVRKRTALQPVRGSGGIRTTATPWHPCRALHGCISRPSALLKEALCEPAILRVPDFPLQGEGLLGPGHLAVGAPGTRLLHPQPRSLQLRTSFLGEPLSPPISNILSRHQLSID